MDENRVNRELAGRKQRCSIAGQGCTEKSAVGVMVFFPRLSVTIISNWYLPVGRELKGISPSIVISAPRPVNAPREMSPSNIGALLGSVLTEPCVEMLSIGVTRYSME